MKNQFSLIAILMLISITTQAQVAINTNGNTANASAALDISSNTTGLLIPRMTTVERVAITTPATGLMVYDNTTNGFWYYNGTAWTEISAATSTGDKITDADNDTKIQVEKSTDDDAIRFDLAGVEHMVLDLSGGYSRLRFPANSGNFLVGSQISNTITGGNNFVFGTAAGGSLTSANSNLFHGRFSGENTETGSYNIYIGEKTGNQNITGNGNVIIGESAGYNNVGSNSVFIGFKAGYNETSGNRLYIDNSTTSTPLIYGEFNNDFLRINGDLEVTGTTQIGSNGTSLNSIIKQTVSVNLPNIGGNGILHQNMTVTGATVGATVFVSPAKTLLGSCFIGYARVVSANVVEVTFLNEGSNGQNHLGMNFYITVIQ